MKNLSSQERILTVTLNPAIDWNIVTDRIVSEEKNEVLDSYRVAGGKGINVSRVLNRLGTPNKAFVILGSSSGKEFQKLARLEKLSLSIFWIKGETRTNLTLAQKKSAKQIRINQSGPFLLTTELKRLKNRLQKEILNASIVVFSGSLPQKMPNRFLVDLLKFSQRHGKKTVVDTADDTLLAIKNVPLWLLKANQKEWKSMGSSASKAEWILVSLGKNGAQLRGTQIQLKVRAKKIKAVCTVGAGDSLLAGFLHALRIQKDPATSLKMAVAAGTASAMNEPGRLADLNKIRSLSPCSR